MNDEDRCPERESGGVRCELPLGHDGGHTCPDALAEFKARMDEIFKKFPQPPPTDPRLIFDAGSARCDHGLVFDETEALRILGEWQPEDEVAFIVGNPRHAEVRRRFPRLFGRCPKGCGVDGIGYASMEHYQLGDW